MPTSCIDFVQLSERANDKVEPLSGGMKRRLTIARSLVNDPELLLLDEPTTGLDPQARHTVWDRLFRLKQRGVTLDPHDALHGRGRAALRPPRRHGQGQDRRRGLAAGAHPAATPRARCVELRFRAENRPEEVATELESRLDGFVRRLEALPDRAAALHRRRRRHRLARPRARSAARERPRPPLDARGRLPPSRPAEPWWTIEQPSRCRSASSSTG